MIDGVKIKQLTVHNDIPDTPGDTSKGVLMEIVRSGDGFLSRFGQSVCTISHGRGTIKAFHWHKKQDDLWFIATGKARVILYDRRENSATHGQTDVISAGAEEFKIILIPKGVAHGYQVLSDEPVLLFYHVTETYDAKNPDEQRIPFDDPKINFNWTL